VELRDRIVPYAKERAESRGVGFEWVERQSLPITPMNDGIVEALRAEAEATGEPFLVMPSGAAHDTMCVADKVPTAMVFVPCEKGISHNEIENADPVHLHAGTNVMLHAVLARANR
jgi:acetylornithine deacetylase/succinyl-diaminopimelate desuccinylase-like protein